ncbi:CAMK protein kinase [Histomonas meleagridis]|uniref:CAMK protein kinase n=1 Tax=Histomonas meleagridis TaxID=135588 RepID=UPI003559E67D|nr:CAMK protein kinase [Histomonas meleagridis]KAH0798826.1 CAMK protein kinase [Histomonas meleagridis]
MLYTQKNPNERELSPDEIFSMAQDAFNRCDADVSGSLDKQEFINFYVQLGYGSDTAAGHVFEAADIDKNGRITFDEFWNLFVSMYTRNFGNIGPLAKIFFDGCDEGHKGYLTRSEFIKFMTMSNVCVNSKQEIEDQIQSYDINGDGKITFDEIITNENQMKSAREFLQQQGLLNK